VVNAPPAAHPASPVVSGIRVRVAPPPLRQEVRPAAPSANHIWIDGHWAWRGGQHTWVQGVWAMPPAVGYVWVPARWENVGGEYVFYEGHWNYAQEPVQETYYEPPPQEQVVEVETAPPEPVYEVRPAMPFAGAIWMPGFWRWHGHHHIWVGGHWSAPREGYRWREGHWVEREHRYRWEGGRWER
jgi:hypothetical protein